MEVDKHNFRKQLLPLLTHISNAKFVTFDFEMSGITAKPKNGSSDRANDIGKRTLQQQYEEMKTVAETFQVLQVGICCVEEDLDREYYLARPFNFYLSPLHADGVDFKMDRRFEFSSSACDFLLKNSFDFGKVFSAGVPYLSRHEEMDIRKREAGRADRDQKIPDISLAPGSPELDFYRAARITISTWVEDPKPERSWVNIDNGKDKDLNGFQRRLIYQLVRSEFPGYRTFGKLDGSFMQVVKTDPEEELKRQKVQLERLNGRLATQTGLRWIFEALANGNLNGIPLRWFCDDSGENPDLQKDVVEPKFEALKKKIEKKDHIIVGHNLFTDLVFLYNTFFGQLPELVEDFQEAIHRLFPTILDTKYINTEGDNAMSGRSGLKEILTPFLKVHTPLIVLHEQHTSYGALMGKDHEAGFDSWMTAELFVKLTTKLYADRKHLLRDPDAESEPDYEANSKPNPDLESSPSPEISPESSDSGGVLIDFSDYTPPSTNSLPAAEYLATIMGDDLPPAWHERQLQLVGGQNRFATLADLGETLREGPVEPKASQWIPKWESSFWDIYVNKLRVNAAEHGVCDLNGED